jgi:hypothetical protein
VCCAAFLSESSQDPREAQPDLTIFWFSKLLMTASIGVVSVLWSLGRQHAFLTLYSSTTKRQPLGCTHCVVSVLQQSTHFPRQRSFYSGQGVVSGKIIATFKEPTHDSLILLNGKSCIVFCGALKRMRFSRIE